MKKGWIITIVILVLMVIVLAWVFNPFESTNKIIGNCVIAGELSSFPSPTFESKQCCNGLDSISDCYAAVKDYPEEDCHSATGCGMICSDCGNNICEDWENRCNCPVDCK